MLTSRNYIIADANIAGHVQRNSKTLSFYSLIVEVTRRLIAFDENAAQISMWNMNGEHGPGGLMSAVHEMMNRLLAPGPALDAITAIQMESMSGMLNDEQIVSRDTHDTVTNLYAWQRHVFSLCNARAIYGPQNIFAEHPELENEFWQFEHGMLGLVVDILPSITARKAHKARAKVLAGLVEYVDKERYKNACPLIQERVQTNLAFGMSPEMAGHAELILMFGILGNAVPTNFWLISNIFSRPDLVTRIRTEVEHALSLDKWNNANREPTTFKISAKAINMKSCPLLYSCYRETLRHTSLLTSARLSTDDTLVPRGTGKLDNYLLRKDSVVQIAGGVLHEDSRIWGKDAEQWNPERFLVAPETTTTSLREAAPLPTGVPSAAFRAYGGGTVICPGRHFAQSELMTLAAVLCVGFDVTNPDGSLLTLPAKDEERIPLSNVKPVYDPVVKITRRKGWEQVKFDVGV